jgi:hypothetical protein
MINTEVEYRKLNLKMLNDVEVKQYQLNVSDRFAILESLDDYVDIHRAFETIRMFKPQPVRF